MFLKFFLIVAHSVAVFISSSVRRWSICLSSSSSPGSFTLGPLVGWRRNSFAPASRNCSSRSASSSVWTAATRRCSSSRRWTHTCTYEQEREVYGFCCFCCFLVSGVFFFTDEMFLQLVLDETSLLISEWVSQMFSSPSSCLKLTLISFIYFFPLVPLTFPCFLS